MQPAQSFGIKGFGIIVLQQKCRIFDPEKRVNYIIQNFNIIQNNPFDYLFYHLLGALRTKCRYVDGIENLLILQPHMN